MQIEEGQTIQWSKEKGQKDKQRTRDRATRTLLKTGVTLSDQCNIINLLYQPAWAILVTLGEIIMILLIILSKTQSFTRG
jgi:hypothetical protein